MDVFPRKDSKLSLDSPDGPLSPRLAAATPTSLQVVWSTPARNNAPGSRTYQLQMRPGPSTHNFLEFPPNPSASLSYEVSDLQPFTVYELRSVATDGFGSTHSAWTPLMTAEDTFQDLQGDVEYYILLWNSGALNKPLKIFPDVDSRVIGILAPNTECQIFLLVFNEVCGINSTVVHRTTCNEEPQGMLPPEVVIINRTAVRVIWTSSSNPNGRVSESSVYVINKLSEPGTDVRGPFIRKGLSPVTICDIQACCDGLLYDPQPGSSGSEQRHITSLPNSTAVCRGGPIHKARPDHQCCSGYDTRVLPGVLCCGQDYVKMSDTICCSASHGESKAHVKKNDPVPAKYCDTELIPESRRCCNGVGENPLKYVCPDEISAAMVMKAVITPNSSNGVFQVRHESSQREGGAEIKCTDQNVLQYCARLAGTTRGIPESVSPPNITAQGPETLRLSWSVPEKRKDVVKEDQLWLDGRGLISADTGGSRQHTGTDKSPTVKSIYIQGTIVYIVFKSYYKVKNLTENLNTVRAEE
ncbi:hypothetical protein ACRRTK_005178 [Alexandromys fortis]